MAVTTNTGGTNTGLRWWEQGSTEKRPTYLTNNAASKFLNKQKPLINRATKAYNEQQVLINERNAFYAANKSLTNAPKYTFLEAATLYGRGYSGVFGRSQSKQTVSLLGEEWQQAYALDALRRNKDMLSFSVLNTNTGTTREELAGYKDIVAADRSNKTWSNLFTLYGDYQDMGGEAGYAKRYGKGKPPSQTSKYGILSNLDNKAIRADDVQSTYQNSLATQLQSMSKRALNIAEELNKTGEVPQDKINSVLNLSDVYATLAKDNKIATNKKTGTPSQDKIKAMEDAIIGAGTYFHSLTQEAIGTPSSSYSKDTISRTLGIIGNAGGPFAGQIAALVGQTDAGQRITNNTIDKISAAANSDELAIRSVDWNGNFVDDISANVVNSFARMGVGMVPGMFMLTEEATLAAGATKRTALTGEEFGTGIDFQLGDAIWSDFAERYYDPFAYKANANGDETFQGYWNGYTTADSWQRLGNKVAEDPVTYTLDVLSVIPAIGWAAKGASVASLTGRTGRTANIIRAGEGLDAARAAKVEAEAAVAANEDIVIRVENLTNKEHSEWRAAHDEWLDTNTKIFDEAREAIINSPEQLAAEAQVDEALRIGMDPADPNFPKTPLTTLNDEFANKPAYGVEPTPADFAGPRILDSAESVLASIRENPELLDVLDQDQIRAAAKIVNANKARTALLDADAELVLAERALGSVPSARTFRRVARKAIAGDAVAVRQMDAWKALGYDFNNAQNNVLLRFSAKFEERTKILDAPPSNLIQSNIAMIRLPASPVARGAKEFMLWAGRHIVDPGGAKVAQLGAATNIEAVARLTSKFVDFPMLGYRWKYTKAVQDAVSSDWGDVASEMRFAADNYNLVKNTSVDDSMQEAILAQIYGGTGATSATAPSVRRAAINDKLDSITVDGKFVQDVDGRVTSRFIAGTEDQAESLLANRERMLAEAEGTINERAILFDEAYHSNRAALRRRLADPTFNAHDPLLDDAVELYRRIQRQHDNISMRLVHTESSPSGVAALKRLYTEVMNGLKLGNKDLFGKNGNSGRIGAYVDSVVRLNTSIAPHTSGLYDLTDDAIIFSAQHPKKAGTVFDNLAGDVADNLKADWIRFIRTITEDGTGLFRRGDSSPNAEAAPVVVLAPSQKGVPRGFTRVQLPRLRHGMDKGNIVLGKIIDKNESFIIPNSALVTKKVGKGPRRAVVLDTTSGRNMLETGALNAMSDVYPNARFYSEKIGETGLNGVRQNERQLKNEGVIAVSALREHNLAIAVRSEINHYKARMQDSIIRAAEEQAVLIPASLIAGKSSAESGYVALKMVRTFDSIDEAAAFARVRGVETQFNTGVRDGLTSSESIATAPEGLSKIVIDGKEQFIVRGTVDDWARHAGDEDLAANSIMSDYKNRNYEDPNDIGNRGMVLALPNMVDKKLSLMVIDGNTYATRILDNSWAKLPTSAFKRIVLNMRLGFINANVIGGTSMLMMRNPLAAGKILARAIAKNAGLSGDSTLSKWAGDSAAVDRILAWEQDHNVYRQDAGIGAAGKDPTNLLDTASKSAWVRKYIWNGGYTTVAAFERQVRNAVGVDFLTSDPAFRAFMDGPEVKAYIDNGLDYTGTVRPKDGADSISPFEAAVDLLLDRNSPLFSPDLKNRMRYTTNTVSGNYHNFSPFETMLRNFAMPFYAWQRHSLTYSWRMMVDKPITANAIYKVSQQGYNQIAEQGVEDYLRQTIPLPSVLKEHLGMIPEDFRIDMSNINPYGTSTDMVSSFYSVLTGDKVAKSIFQFGNPYLNNLIEDQLGVDPVSGDIDWARLAGEDQNGAGIFGTTMGMFDKVNESTIFGSAGRLRDAIDNVYAEDALANKYPAIESKEDALKVIKNMYTTDAAGNPVSKGLSGWSLSIPSERNTGASSRSTDIFNALGFKSYLVNSENLSDQSRREDVAALALAYYNNKKMADDAVSDLNALSNWQNDQAFITQVWLPAARTQGIDEATIQLVLLKLQKDKPKGGKSIDPNLLMATMGG